MDGPRGSVEHVSGELERLRRRAYAPDADIAEDAVAQARLAELERAQRRQLVPAMNAASLVPESAEGLTKGGEHGPIARDAMGDEPPTDGERANGQAFDGAEAPSLPAAVETKARGPYRGRARRIVPWAIAAVAALGATIAIGLLVVDEWSEPRPVARLAAQGGLTERPIQIDEEFAKSWGWNGADFVSHGTYGEAEIWSTTTLGPKHCLVVIVGGGTWRFTCTSPTLDATADIDIDSDMVPPAPSGEPASNIRFVLHDGVVDVYLAPNPEGGYY